MPKPNRYKEAFTEQGNIVGLASAVALSAALLNPLPLVVAAVAEAAYLIFVPDTRWYEVRLSQRFDAEVVKRREELKARVLPACRPEIRDRFQHLEAIRAQIGAQRMEPQTWFREVVRKLDFLLEKFLQFAAKDTEFRAYLQSLGQELNVGVGNPGYGRNGNSSRRGGQRGRDEVQGPPSDPDDRWAQRMVALIQEHYTDEMDGARGMIQKEQDPNTGRVLEKRIEVLQRRQEFVGKIGRILTNLSQQLHLLEDSFGLINDELCARSPEQVLADIEDVVGQTNAMTSMLEELAPYEQMLQRLST